MFGDFDLEILSAIALALLTLVGYSSGVTLASRKRPFLPTILDLLLVTGLWLVVFWLRGRFESRWLLLGIGLALGIALGYVATAVRLMGKDTRSEIPKSELPEHARDKVVKVQDGNIFKRLWLRWNTFAPAMGNVQARIIMGFFYFIVVTPFGLITRVISDPLNMKHQPSASNWSLKEMTDTTIQSAQKQG